MFHKCVVNTFWYSSFVINLGGRFHFYPWINSYPVSSFIFTLGRGFLISSFREHPLGKFRFYPGVSAGSRLRVMCSFVHCLVCDDDCVVHVSLLLHTQSYHIVISDLNVIMLFMYYCSHIHNHITLSCIIHESRIYLLHFLCSCS